MEFVICLVSCVDAAREEVSLEIRRIQCAAEFTVKRRQVFGLNEIAGKVRSVSRSESARFLTIKAKDSLGFIR